VASLGFHATALVAAMVLMRSAPREASRMVDGVDLIVRRAAPTAAAAVKPPPLSTFDFLKLALPTVQHAAAPAELAAALPQHRAVAAEPKLEDLARKEHGVKLDALDLSRKPNESAARLDADIETRRRAAATLSSLPALEDVGRRRVKNLPEALALDEQRTRVVEQAGLPEVAASSRVPTRRRALAAAAALQDAAPPPPSVSGAPRRGLESLLPDRPLLDARPQEAAAPRVAPAADTLARPTRRPAAAAPAEAEPPKKGVEIEGPLADRRVVSYSVPAFPDWAKNQGILEADVSIRFTVDENGSVMTGMRVTSSSSYGRIDKLALDALQAWRFEPKPGAGVEWGVITFKFILE
jgi:TonB family protein